MPMYIIDKASVRIIRTMNNTEYTSNDDASLIQFSVNVVSCIC